MVKVTIVIGFSTILRNTTVSAKFLHSGDEGSKNRNRNEAKLGFDNFSFYLSLFGTPFKTHMKLLTHSKFCKTTLLHVVFSIYFSVLENPVETSRVVDILYLLPDVLVIAFLTNRLNSFNCFF